MSEIKVKKKKKSKVRSDYSRLKANVILYKLEMKGREAAYIKLISDIKEVIDTNKNLSSDVVDILNKEVEMLTKYKDMISSYEQRRRNRKRNLKGLSS